MRARARRAAAARVARGLGEEADRAPRCRGAPPRRTPRPEDDRRIRAAQRVAAQRRRRAAGRCGGDVLMVSAAMSPLAVATPTVAPGATAAPQAQPGHFAKELSRHTQDAPAKREAPAEKTDDKAADDAAQSPQAQPTRARQPAP